MKIAPLPDNEDARLAELKHYHILDTPPEEAFDDLTILAAQICGTPIALVSLVDANRLWFKSKIGIDTPETPRDITFCAHAIHGNDLFVVPDTIQDERFADNPLVSAAPHIRFYAGMPLTSPNGHAMGTLCVIDRVPRQLTDTQQDALRRLGRQAVNMILLGQSKQYEHALRTSEERYRTLFLSSQDAIMTLAPPTWQFTSGNPATVRIFRAKDEAEFVTLGPWELSPERQPDGRLSLDKAREMIDTAMRGGSHFFEWTHLRRTGESFPAIVLLTRMEINGQPQLQATVRDISEQKNAEEAIRTSETRLRCTLDVATDGLWDWSFPTLQAYYSPSWIRLLGLDDQDIPLNNIFDWKHRIHQDDRPCVEQALIDHLEGRTASYEVEHRVHHRSGEWKWFSMRGKVVQRDEQGRPTRMMGTMIDITERKQANASLCEQEARLRTILDHVVDGIITIDDAGIIESFNPAACQIFGYTPTEVIGRNVKILMPDSYQSQHDGYLARYRQTKQATIIGVGREVVGLRKDGSLFPLELAVSQMEFGSQQHFTGIIRDITDRKRVESAFRESEEHQRLLIEQITDYAIIRLDTEGCIVSWNNGATRITGYEEKEILGKPVSRLYGHDEEAINKPDQLLQTALTQGRAEDEGWRIRKDGSHYWANVIITPLYNQDGKLRGFSNVTRDITDHKTTEHRLEQATLDMEFRAIELEEAHERALAATKTKSEFLASMSHEIRTPINAIIAMADLLQDTPLSKEQQEYVGWLNRAATSLLDLINDILDISKIEAGRLDIESVTFDINDLVDMTAELMTARAQAKHLELSTFVNPAISTWRIGDPTRLRQIFVNLVGNAIKFTERGDVAIHVEPNEANPAVLQCTVSDTGIGIPSDKIDSIFESFTQVDSSTTRKYGGTGLGLSICKRLVELMGGTISVNSMPGLGSTFSFSAHLPISPAPATTSLSATFDLHLQGCRLLVAEGNETIRMVIRRYLEPLGTVLIETSDGLTTLNALSSAKQQGQPFALAILDSHIANLDGSSLIKAIREREDTRSLPVIMLSPHMHDSNLRLASDIDCTNYLHKPISRKRLLETLATALRRGPIVSSVTPASTVKEPAGLRPLRILLAEDLEDNRAIVRLFLKDTPHIIEEAENGSVAVQKFQDGAYDLVFMDMQMPVMDGLVATAAIQAWERDHQRTPTPIIALTANAFQEDLNKSIAAGCVAHMTKPVRKNTLLAVIAQYTRPMLGLAA